MFGNGQLIDDRINRIAQNFGLTVGRSSAGDLLLIFCFRSYEVDHTKFVLTNRLGGWILVSISYVGLMSSII